MFLRERESRRGQNKEERVGRMRRGDMLSRERKKYKAKGERNVVRESVRERDESGNERSAVKR